MLQSQPEVLSQPFQYWKLPLMAHSLGEAEMLRSHELEEPCARGCSPAQPQQQPHLIQRIPFVQTQGAEQLIPL